MKKFIVTTTINPVTKAIEIWDSMSDWNLIVIGDKKTPKDYKLINGKYYSPEDQEKYLPDLSNALGWNNIQRRNIGLVIAYLEGADIVSVVDDDNIPLSNWGSDLLLNKKVETNHYLTDDICFDPIGATNHSNLWHRGFPIQSLPGRKYNNKVKKNLVPDIQADFWNGDPDIDAICRMEHASECLFDDNYFPITSSKIAPFNSQNTFISRKVLPDYFLYPFVGRMDDIWAAYYAQSVGHSVVFNKPSVYQQRNEHDLTVDFTKEVIGYENNLKLLHDLMLDPNSIKKYLPGKSIYAWDLYRKYVK